MGAYVGTRQLLKELGIDSPELYQMETSVINDRSGDLAGMLNLSGNIIEEEFDVKAQGYSYREAIEIENNFYGAIVYSMPHLSKRKLFVRRDSFCTAMIPYLKSNFSDSMLVHCNSYSPEAVWDYQPDVFVLETVERYLLSLVNPIL